MRDSGIPFVILRPSLVYGGGESGLVGALVRHLRTLPVMPVIGDGRIQLDPVHLDDLCGVIEACLERDDVLGRTYDVLGPDRVTLDDFLRRSWAASSGCGVRSSICRRGRRCSWRACSAG